MPTLRETCDYYCDLLLFQYRNAPRARATIAIYVKQALGDLLAVSLNEAFDLDQAVGPQLDILGKYIGVPRNIGTPVPRPYYSFSDYDGTVRDNGFTDYTDAGVNAQAIWYQYQFSGTENTSLTDAAYALILQLKIILNSSDGTLASIQNYLHTFLFGLVALVDNKDMTLTYVLSQQIPVDSNVLKAYLPKPMGVGVNFIALEALTDSTATGVLTVPHGDPSLHTVFSNPVFVTTHNGVPPFTYVWQYVDGDIGIQIVNPFTSPLQEFSKQGTLPTDVTGRWQCIVTDSRGLVAYTNFVSIHLVIQEAP